MSLNCCCCLKDGGAFTVYGTFTVPFCSSLTDFADRPNRVHQLDEEVTALARAIAIVIGTNLSDHLSPGLARSLTYIF